MSIGSASNQPSGASAATAVAPRLVPTANGSHLSHGARESAFTFGPNNLLTGGLLAIAFVGLFHYWLYVQNFLSWHVEDWTHAYFVPLISLYLLWQRRDELAAAKPALFWPGVLPMLFGINAYLLFQIGAINNHMAQGWSLILTLFGLLLFVGGPRLMQVLFLPIAYLVFAVAVSDPIMRGLTLRAQLLATEGAWVLLNLIGFTCDLDGNVLSMQTNNFGIQPLNVAEACAGMRMVIGFVALGAAVSLVATRLWWKRAALFLLAVPVAVLMNIVRVAFLGVLSNYNPELAKGQSHMFMGTLVLVAAFVLYMGVVWAMNMAAPEVAEKGAAKEAVTLGTFWRAGEPVSGRALARPGFVVPMLVLAMSAVAVPVSVWAMGIHLRKKPIEAPGGRVVGAIPSETASWARVGKDVQESSEMIEELGTLNYLTRSYLRKNTRADQAQYLNLHMAYYTGGIDTIPHVPERCLVGGGWQITGATRVVPLELDKKLWRPELGATGPDAGQLTFAVTDREYCDANDSVRVRLPRMPGGLGLRITEFTHPKTGKKLFAGYFFIANGTVTDSADNVRLLAFDLRTEYAYYLKVQFSTETATSADELAQQASSLASELLPEIMRCVPDWGEVEAGTYPPDNPRAKKAGSGAGPAANNVQSPPVHDGAGKK